MPVVIGPRVRGDDQRAIVHFQTALCIPRRDGARTLFWNLTPPIKEGVGNAGCRCTRSLAWKMENTRVSHREDNRIARHSRTRMVLTVSFVLAPETGLCCLRG